MNRQEAIEELTMIPGTPAERIIKKFGSPKILAGILGVDLSSVYRWTHPKERSGTGGIVPFKYHRQIAEEARMLGIEITAEDFISL